MRVYEHKKNSWRFFKEISGSNETIKNGIPYYSIHMH